jgi:uncharacterized protein (TIRG00374 family)
MPKTKPKISIDRREIVLAVLFILALYVLIPQFSSFHDSWRLLRHLNTTWTAFAVYLILTTYLFAALTYYLLALYRLKYFEVVIVQFAATAVNRLLPAGVGALGANYAYLRNRQHNRTQAASVVTVNNLFGLLGHSLIVLFIFLLSSNDNRHLIINSEHGFSVAVKLFFVLAIILIFLGFVFSSKRLKRGFTNLRKQLVAYRQRPGRLIGALLSSMALTLCNVFCLYSCMNAVGIHLPILIVLIIFTFGLSTGTVTPTPGGLGGFEAGLVAGFVAFHVSSGSALAIALLFRLISYWLALLIGLFAFVNTQRNHLFGT